MAVNFKSFSKLLNSMIQGFLSKSGVTDINNGSVTRTLIETAALNDFSIQQSIIAALNSANIDRAESIDLDAVGKSEGIARVQARTAIGLVKFYQKNMTKIATKIYAAQIAPPVGSALIYVADASEFPATGAIYVGRGSNNVEGPINYTSITQVGAYYQINLSSPTTKTHNVNETIVLAQNGNRFIPAGTVVSTESNQTTTTTNYVTNVDANILDGEVQILDVPVTCTIASAIGNVAAGSVVVIASQPFVDAAVTNVNPFTSGSDTENDASYRLSIKRFRQNKTKGTQSAIESSVIGATSIDDSKSITSSQLNTSTNTKIPSVLYIDDSTAYQPLISNQGYEILVNSASGGEKYFQLKYQDLVKAQAETIAEAPFYIVEGMVLAVSVGGVRYEHTFAAADFKVQTSANAFEIVNSINANSFLGFNARLISNSKRVAIFSKQYVNEEIQVLVPSNPLAVNANDSLQFPDYQIYTLRLYKNDELLFKDGVVPSVYSLSQADWTPLASTAYITIQCDGGATIVYNFSLADFISLGYSSFTSSIPLTDWAKILTDKINGAVITVESGKLKFTSNKGANDDAAVSIKWDATGATGIASGTNLAEAFIGLSSTNQTLSAQGASSDYSLNTATGQIELKIALVKGDKLTSGSINTAASLNTQLTLASIASGSISIPATPPAPQMWLIVDESAVKVPTIVDIGTNITFANASNQLTMTFSGTNPLASVTVGDYVVLADTAIYSLDSDYIDYFRVISKPSNSQIVVNIEPGTGTNGSVTLVDVKKVFFVRTAGTIQAIDLAAVTGLQTLNSIAKEINLELVGAKAYSIFGKQLSIQSNTTTTGSIYLIGNTNSLNILGFKDGILNTAQQSQVATVSTGNLNSSNIDFFHMEATSNTDGTNIDFVDASSIGLNSQLTFLNAYSRRSTNFAINTQVESVTGNNVQITPINTFITAQDRVYFSQGLNLGALDTFVVVIDNDVVNKTMTIRPTRRGQVTTSPLPSQDTFKAIDIDGGPAANYATFFGDNYSFDNFKIEFHARQIINPDGANNKMLLRSKHWGLTGEATKVGIFYPMVPNAEITTSVNNKDFNYIDINLASGAERLGGGWDQTTQFDISLSGSTTRYTWNNLGSDPNFVSLANVLVGDIVNIVSTANFAPDNQGIFKVTNVTDNYFEVYNPYGVNENGVLLNNAIELRFYILDPVKNKATDIQAFVATNLASYIEIQQFESGAGVVATSTYDDNLSTDAYLKLVDGVNWVAASTVGTRIAPVNLFTLKKQLVLQEIDPNYTLVGEDFFIIPTTAKQLVSFLNTVAVTGLSSIANITTSQDGQGIQITSLTFGTAGSVFITGGIANAAAASVTINANQTIAANLKYRDYTQNATKFYSIDRHNLNAGEKFSYEDVSFTADSVTPRTLADNLAVPFAATTVNLSRVSNIVTATATSPVYTAIKIGDKVTIFSVIDPTFNVIGATVVTIPGANQFTYIQNDVNATATGTITTIRQAGGIIKLLDLSVGISKFTSAGLYVGQYVEIINNSVQAKSLGLSNTSAIAITTPNRIDLSGAGTFQTVVSSSIALSDTLRIEKQSQFTAISIYGASAITFANIQEGNYIQLQGASINDFNEGIFRVEKKYLNNTIYIINEDSVEEDVVISNVNDIKFYTSDSVLPGDVLEITTNLLGVANKGTYIVDGNIFPTSTTIYIKNPPNLITASAPLNLDFSKFVIKESIPNHSYKKIVNINQNYSNANLYEVVLEGANGARQITVNSGSNLVPQGKIRLPEGLETGISSYEYYRGLIREAGKIIRGDQRDKVTYPGVQAAGTYIVVEPPLPKRVQLGIVIRNQSGIPFGTLKSRIQTAVAAYVNGLGVNENVAFSSVISQIQQINGVVAVAISSPLYDATHDLILVGYNEKAQIIDIDTDVIVSLQDT